MIVRDDRFRSWFRHFEQASLEEPSFAWDEPRRLTPVELASIAASLQQFQLGEGAGGKRLLRRGLTFSQRIKDPYFSAALALFVKEEQRHHALLGRFLEREGIPQIEHHWLDGIFRRLRNLAGLELNLRVLVTAETIAVPYYRALERATSSPLLRALSVRILSDETAHLRYQAAMLAKLAEVRPAPWRRAADAFHALLLTASAWVVWISHRKALRAGGYSLWSFASETLEAFAGLRCEISRYLAQPAHRSSEPAAAAR
ncbi:MAG: ferritin-like domain-containing protein [Bryobacteraceae bacterium]